MNLVRAWPGTTNRRHLNPSPGWFLATPLTEFRAEPAKPPAMCCPSYSFLPSLTFSPCFVPSEQVLACCWSFTPVSSLLFMEHPGRLKHYPELEQVPKGRVVFEKREKIRFNGVFRMKYLLVLDISMVESCLLSFTIGQSWGLLPQKCPGDWLGLPATGTTLNFKEPEMVKEHLLCQPINADALCRIFMCGFHSASAPFLPCTFSNNSIATKVK